MSSTALREALAAVQAAWPHAGGMALTNAQREALKAVDAALSAPEAQQGEPVAMSPMEFEDGRKGWYVDHPEFYCDIEPDEAGVWSAYFRDRHDRDAFANRGAAPQAPAGSEAADVARWREYAQHLEWCRTCAEDSVGSCHEGVRLQSAAQAGSKTP